MRKKIVGLFLILLAFNSCKEPCSNNVCLISTNFWTTERRHRITDSALYIGLYKETDNYLNYWTTLVQVPYKIPMVLKNEFELVDGRTIYWNKGSRHSNDYKQLLKKGLIRFSANKDGINDSLDGIMYVVRKRDKALKAISLVTFFEALENNETARLAQSKSQEDSGFDEVSGNFFSRNQ